MGFVGRSDNEIDRQGDDCQDACYAGDCNEDIEQFWGAGSELQSSVLNFEGAVSVRGSADLAQLSFFEGLREFCFVCCDGDIVWAIPGDIDFFSFSGIDGEDFRRIQCFRRDKGDVGGLL